MKNREIDVSASHFDVNGRENREIAPVTFLGHWGAKDSWLSCGQEWCLLQQFFRQCKNSRAGIICVATMIWKQLVLHCRFCFSNAFCLQSCGFRLDRDRFRIASSRFLVWKMGFCVVDFVWQTLVSQIWLALALICMVDAPIERQGCLYCKFCIEASLVDIMFPSTSLYSTVGAWIKQTGICSASPSMAHAGWKIGCASLLFGKTLVQGN